MFTWVVIGTISLALLMQCSTDAFVLKVRSALTASTASPTRRLLPATAATAAAATVIQSRLLGLRLPASSFPSASSPEHPMQSTSSRNSEDDRDPSNTESDNCNGTSSETSHGFRDRICSIIQRAITESADLRLVSLKWIGDRCEVIVDSLGADEEPVGHTKLELLHRRLIQDLEKDSAVAEPSKGIELIVATPGIGNVLRRDIDFQSFRGFPVLVSYLHDHRSKTIAGTLIGRDSHFVRISVKGRPTKIDRQFVSEVRFPITQYESGDLEARKLQ